MPAGERVVVRAFLSQLVDDLEEEAREMKDGADG